MQKTYDYLTEVSEFSKFTKTQIILPRLGLGMKLFREIVKLCGSYKLCKLLKKTIIKR